jgi:putative hydrolase of HD superfamily
MVKNGQEEGAIDLGGKDMESNQAERLMNQIEFIREIDKLKLIERRTLLMDGSRRENSVEHSWHIALTVLILSEYAGREDIDILRVLKILLVHDIIEIDAGDTYCYDDQGRKDQAQREEKAADRIFNILPSDQRQSLCGLWDEFEAGETPESLLANALDRFQPLLHNFFTEGLIWRQNKIKSSQVLARMQPIKDGAPLLWEFVIHLIKDCVAKGYLLP